MFVLGAESPFSDSQRCREHRVMVYHLLHNTLLNVLDQDRKKLFLYICSLSQLTRGLVSAKPWEFSKQTRVSREHLKPVFSPSENHCSIQSHHA